MRLFNSNCSTADLGLGMVTNHCLLKYDAEDIGSGVQVMKGFDGEFIMSAFNRRLLVYCKTFSFINIQGEMTERNTNFTFKTLINLR